MKLAIREGMIPGDSLRKKLEWLSNIGIEGVELHGASLSLSVWELRSIFANSPISVANISGPADLLSPDSAVRRAAMDLGKRRLYLAAELGATGVLLVPQFGTKPLLPDLSPYRSAVELERELFITQMRELSELAETEGTIIFLEPLNRYEAHLVNTLQDACNLAREIGPRVRIMADFFHMNIEEADIAQSIKAAADQIVYVHVADSNRLQPGKGHIDFNQGFRALKEIGYDGYLGIECRIAGELESALQECAHLLREWWQAA